MYKNDGGDWVDSGYGYELDTNDASDLPAGLSYDPATGYSFNMALTVGGTAEDGSEALLKAGEDYKIAVQACKTVDDVNYRSGETLSDAAYLPEYTPLDMELMINGAVLAVDAESQVYVGYVVDDGAELRVSAENASLSAKTMDGTPITQSYGGFTIPNFEGSLMLEVEGNVTNNGITDTTTRYVLIYKDNIAPIVTLDEPTFFADAETGDFTVSGITEPGATVDYSAVDEESRPITVQADADGRFSISGSLDKVAMVRSSIRHCSSPSPMPERTRLRLL